MRTFLFILAATIGIGAFGATNEPSIQMLSTTNGVVKLPTNITQVRIGGTVFTNLLGFGLSVTNGQLSVDTTQLPAGGGSGVVTSVSEDFEIDAGELSLTNALGTGPLVRQSAASGVGTVTSVGLSTSLSGLSIVGSPVESSGTITLSGTLGLSSGGTGATDASGARTALSLVPGTDVQAYDTDLAAIAALANSGIIVRTGAGTVAARAITGDTEAVVSNGDGVSGNPTLSIGSGITRDSELTAALLGETWRFGSGSPLDAFHDNGDYYFDEDTGGVWLKAAGTWTLQSNFQTIGGTNIIAHLATKAPLASPAFTTSATIGGTNVLDYAATHLTEAEASALYQRTNNVLTTVANLTGGNGSNFLRGDGTFAQVGTNDIPGLVAALAAGGGGGLSDGGTAASLTVTNLTTERQTLNFSEVYNAANGDVWSDGHQSAPITGTHNITFWPWGFGIPLASGNTGAATGNTNRPSIPTIKSSATANSGYVFANGGAIRLAGGEFIEGLFSFCFTNATVIRFGFIDSFGTSASADGAYCELANGWLYGVCANNTSYSYTTTSNLITTSTTSRDRLRVRVNSDATSVNFQWLSATAAGVFTTNWTADVTGTIPTTRDTSYGLVAYYVTGGANDLLYVDALGTKFGRANIR